MKTRIKEILGSILGISLLIVAVLVLHNELKTYHLHEIIEDLKNISSYRLLAAVILTFFSYLIMTGYDFLALRYIQKPLPYYKISLASSISYAFSNNVGLSMVAGASIRYRLYSIWGLSAFEITKVIAFISLSFWLGILSLGGTLFILEPLTVPHALHLPFSSIHLFGVFCLSLVGGYFLFTILRKKPFKIRNREFILPSRKIFILQIIIAILDWTLAGYILYLLLPDMSTLHFLQFLEMYLIAQLLGLFSQLPGGIGVFEAVILLLLSPYFPASAIIGALLAYRGIYYFAPLTIAALVLGIQEVFRKREKLKKFLNIFDQWAPLVIPHVLTFTTFIGGVILLFSGTTPAKVLRLNWLNYFIPLSVIEASHFFGSLVGTGLIILARGLQRRIDAAYVSTIILLTAGIIFSLLKGFDYEEAIALSILLAALIPCRKYFYRKASLFYSEFSPGSIAALGIVIICAVWLVLFSYKHVEYSNELWWQFTLMGDASRSLRAGIGVMTVILFFLIMKLMQPTSEKYESREEMNLERVSGIVSKSPQAYANLALLDDKKFLFSDQGNAFIMYNKEGRSWIVMGDPVGSMDEWPELIWNFVEMCDRFDGSPVFYEVESKNLSLYIDIGLNLLKLGEEAHIPLKTFSLEGSAHKGFRHTLRKLENDGYIFDVVLPEEVSPLLPELKLISDIWLKDKNTREKRFSLGYFDENYLKRFPIGIVKKDGKIIAFANVWLGAEKEELSIDLMRHITEAPNGIMDYLFLKLFLWGKEEGFNYFNFGMAPLSGLEANVMGPLWNRVGNFVFKHGEHFYNFQGLRNYKNKFKPIWKPKYLAYQQNLELPRVFANLASLVSGSLKGAVSK